MSLVFSWYLLDKKDSHLSGHLVPELLWEHESPSNALRSPPPNTHIFSVTFLLSENARWTYTSHWHWGNFMMTVVICERVGWLCLYHSECEISRTERLEFFSMYLLKVLFKFKLFSISNTYRSYNMRRWGVKKGKIVEGVLGSALTAHVRAVKEWGRKEEDEMRGWECKRLHKKAMCGVFGKHLLCISLLLTDRVETRTALNGSILVCVLPFIIFSQMLMSIHFSAEHLADVLDELSTCTCILSMTNWFDS